MCKFTYLYNYTVILKGGRYDRKGIEKKSHGFAA